MKSSILFPVLFISLILFSFQNEDTDVAVSEANTINQITLQSDNATISTSNGDKLTILGQQLQNPYTPANMQTALNNIKSNNPLFYNFNVRTTHKYVKFSPSNYAEFDTLIANSGIELFDYPLDYEILVDGDYYHDPLIPYDTIHPTFQYGVVPFDYDFSKITTTYQIVSNLYLPDEDPVLLAIINGMPIPKPGKENPIERDMDILIDEALYITGNLPSNETDRGIRPPRWTPSGTIKIKDHQLQTDVGLYGAKVKMKRWFKVAIAYTDVNGNFTSGKKFRRDVQYKIKWEHNENAHKWDIRRGWYGQARTGGPTTQGPWIKTFSESDSMPLMYGTITRGCYDFFYNDPFGLEKPNTRLKIAALDKCGTGVNHHMASIIGGPDIRIYRKRAANCAIKNTLTVYSTALHELGHSQHRSLGVAKFAFCSATIRESYASFIEWIFVLNKYAPHKIYDPVSTRHFWLEGESSTTISSSSIELYAVGFSFPSNDEYTTMFIDLVDCVGDNTFMSNERLGDKVCGYTPKQIEQALKHKGWIVQIDKVLPDVRDYLVNNYTNSTENWIKTNFCEYYECP
jgi:hypothetical protein